MTPCPCGFTKSFDLCCGPIIAGSPAPTAETLMRSRYSAYAIGDLDYIQRTSGGEAALKFDRAEQERSKAETVWLGLTIIDTEEGQIGDRTGTVTFTANFRLGNRVFVHTERSVFRRIDNAWRYCSGEVDLGAAEKPVVKLGRNDPCHCGSGKKFKKCCGAG